MNASAWKEFKVAVDAGNENEALSALARVRTSDSENIDFEDEGWDLACATLASGMYKACMKLFDLNLLDYDRVDILRTAAENDDREALIKLSPWFGEEAYLRAAYAAQFELGDGSESKLKAMEIADKKTQDRWVAAMGEGVFSDWKARSGGEYEAICQQVGAPIWSAMAAPGLFDLEGSAREWLASKTSSVEKKVYWAEHEGTAVGLASETLLWNGPEFDHWLTAMASNAELMAGRGSLLAMRDSHALAKELLQPASLAIGKARRTKNPKCIESIATLFQKCDAGRWLPFVVAWSEHAGFKDSDKLCLGPLLDACVVDEVNAGFIAANWTYGSFNARVALIAVELDKRGRVSDGAIEMIAARWRDLRSSDTMSKFIAQSSFREEIVACGEYIEARAQALSIARVVSPGASSSKISSL